MAGYVSLLGFGQFIATLQSVERSLAMLANDTHIMRKHHENELAERHGIELPHPTLPGWEKKNG